METKTEAEIKTEAETVLESQRQTQRHRDTETQRHRDTAKDRDREIAVRQHAREHKNTRMAMVRAYVPLDRDRRLLSR